MNLMGSIIIQNVQIHPLYRHTLYQHPLYTMNRSVMHISYLQYEVLSSRRVTARSYYKVIRNAEGGGLTGAGRTDITHHQDD